MTSVNFLPAIGTPLTDDEDLHVQGLEAQLDDLYKHGIRSIFTAGSMGAMPLLTDSTYRALIKQSVALWRKRGEILAGAGDTSFARTRERIRYLNDFDIDGVVVLCPYFWGFGQDDLFEYFSSLAKIAKKPLYLYDLPQVTGTKIELKTALKLAKVPNIKGAKCSDEPGYARQLRDLLPESFRIIIAQANLVDVFIRHGMNEHLDGMYTMAPEWAIAIGKHVVAGEFEQAAGFQKDLSELLRTFGEYDLPSMTTLMNARGIPGCFAPRPYRKLPPASAEAFLGTPIVRKLLHCD